jgi:cytochrome c oxidase subunit II
MPPPVGRLRLVLTCVVLLALGLAGTALAGNGGLAPPSPASPNAGGIRAVYWLILGVTGGIFLLVEVTLILFVVRYRSRGRPRGVEGPQVRGHTNIELAWTAGPVVILAVVVAFVFYKIAGINNTSGIPAAQGATPRQTIKIEGHQYYWQFTYPNGAVSIDTLRLPVDRVTRFEITAADVDHSWWIPALAGKLDAIPGKTNTTSWRPRKLGTFRGQCAEFCGIQHAAMLAYVQVLPQAKYDNWVQQRRSSPSEVGRESFTGACAKCHGLAGQGDIGPPIATSPLLSDRAALTTVIRQGRGRMPAVGQDWGESQLDATIAYLQKRFKAGGSGGG